MNTNAEPALEKPGNPNAPLATKLLVIEVIQMYEVMEHSMEAMKISRVQEINSQKQSKVHLHALLLSKDIKEEEKGKEEEERPPGVSVDPQRQSGNRHLLGSHLVRG